MQCPSCKKTSLKPVKLQDHLPARECTECKGVLIELLSYRAWQETFYQQISEHQSELSLEESVVENGIAEDNSKAMMCPKCSKFMRKFKISGDQKNKIDVCMSCDEVWLDNGEWELLESLSLQEKFTAIFTEPWQRGIRKGEITLAQDQRHEDSLGKEDYSKILRLKKWIESHPKKDELVRILMFK